MLSYLSGGGGGGVVCAPDYYFVTLPEKLHKND